MMFAKSEKKESSEPRQGFFKKLRARLNRGDSWLTYDLANLAPGGKIDEDVLDELESELVRRYGASGSVLEVGCGTGLVLSRIAQFADKATGVDLSPGMLEQARARG